MFLTRYKILVKITELYRGSIYRSAIYYNMTGLLQDVKHFYLTDSQYSSCKNEQNTSYIKKDTIILYYYSIFLYQIDGAWFTLKEW